MIEQEKMVDVEKSLIQNQWDSAVSSCQHVAEHCHEAKVWTHLKKRKKKELFMVKGTLHSKSNSEMIEN